MYFMRIPCVFQLSNATRLECFVAIFRTTSIAIVAAYCACLVHITIFNCYKWYILLNYSKFKQLYEWNGIQIILLLFFFVLYSLQVHSFLLSTTSRMRSIWMEHFSVVPFIFIQFYPWCCVVIAPCPLNFKIQIYFRNFVGISSV